MKPSAPAARVIAGLLGLAWLTAGQAQPTSGGSAGKAPARGSSVPAPVPTPANRSAAQAQALAAQIAAGQVKAESERCIECHGANGEGAQHGNGPEGKFPKLAGQHPDYLLKQLAEFRSGVRKHDLMALMAKSVELADLKDIVAFFAAQPRSPGDGSQSEAGRLLYLQGDAARQLPACASCHGQKAEGALALGSAAPMPALAGQEFNYLERQLQDWRSGWRKNSAGNAMGLSAKPLTDGDIKALALYLSGLP